MGVFWGFFGGFLGVFWGFFGGFLGVFWWFFGGFLVGFFWFFGGFWWFFGHVLVVFWWFFNGDIDWEVEFRVEKIQKWCYYKKKIKRLDVAVVVTMMQDMVVCGGGICGERGNL